MRTTTSCKKGNHTYGSTGAVGGGLLRRTCRACGSVVIDLGREDRMGDTSLFLRPKLNSLFAMGFSAERLVIDQSRAFGTRPDGRRRAPQEALA